MRKFVSIALLFFFVAEVCWAKGFGTGRKNALFIDGWKQKDDSFGDCVKEKCADKCKKTANISEHAFIQ